MRGFPFLDGGGTDAMVAVVLAVAAGWFILGLVFWVILLGWGVRFELRNPGIPRTTRSSLTIPQRDARLASLRSQAVQESAIRN